MRWAQYFAICLFLGRSRGSNSTKPNSLINVLKESLTRLIIYPMAQTRHSLDAPLVTEMLVIPVAGHDSMLLNLSGAHGPFFTRNVLILQDNSGHTGVGEVPGGEKIRQTLEDSKPYVI